jgi:hypothetical protein
MADARAAASIQNVGRSVGKVGTVLIVLVWIITAAFILYFFIHFIKRI